MLRDGGGRIVKRKQADPDANKAAAFGVESYIPKNVRTEARSSCLRCGRIATKEVSGVISATGASYVEALCDEHAGDAQLSTDRTVTVRRMKLQ